MQEAFMKRAIVYLKDGTRTPIEIHDDHLERYETWWEFERRILKILKNTQPGFADRIQGIHIFRN